MVEPFYKGSLNKKHFSTGYSYSSTISPRILEDFVIHKVSITFVVNELNTIKLSKATGLDGITARLLKDCGSVLAKPLDKFLLIGKRQK